MENDTSIQNQNRLGAEDLSLVLSQALDTYDKETLESIIKNYPNPTIADSLNLISDRYSVLFFSISDDFETLGDIFSYLVIEEREAICKEVKKKQLQNILAKVNDDDLADYIEDLPKTIRTNTLLLLPNKRRQVIENLARFSDDTIGSIMTTEYFTCFASDLVKDVFKKIKETGKNYSIIRSIFVTDSNNILLGIESLENLMFDDENKKMEEVMNKDFAYISPIADKEEAIPICKKYDLAVLPVVSKNGDLLGMITFDAVMDVVEEENTEDLYKQAGIAPTATPYLETKSFKMALSYVIWLIILLVINTFSGMIINKFESALMTLPILVSFIPALNDSCGDAGDQTTSMVTRALATGDITPKDYFKVALKELSAGFLTAVLVATFNFVWVLFEMNAHLLNMDGAFDPKFVNSVGSLINAEMVIAAVVSLAFLVGITLAKLLASSLPILAKICHIDPAVMSGPLIASLMDIITLLVYFGVATALIDAIDPGEIEIGLSQVHTLFEVCL